MRRKLNGKRIAVSCMTASLLLSNMPVWNTPVLAAETDGAMTGEAETESGLSQQAGETQPEAGSEGAEGADGESRAESDAGDSQDGGTEQQKVNDSESGGASPEADNEQSGGTSTDVSDTQSESEQPQTDGTQSSQETDGESDTQSGQETGGEPEAEDGSGNGEESEEDDSEESEEETEDGEETEEETEDESEESEEQSFSLENLPVVDADIILDGELSDWANVTARSSSDSKVEEWKAACSKDGATLYFAYTGNADTEWDYEFAGANRSFAFDFADGEGNRDSMISVTGQNGSATVKDSYYSDIAGADAVIANDAHGNNAGPYAVEFAVPVSFFHSTDFVLTFAGTAVDVTEIEQISGTAAEPPAPPVYSGIVIDGGYEDWAAVSKTSASCPNSAHPGCVAEAAAVYDGDWFYIYIKDGAGSNASQAGTHSNGKFAIYSDLGYESDIQLSTAPSVSGVNGAEVAYVGNQWEIAIPRDQLPKYRESLSFGFYLGEVLVADIVNLQKDSENNLENLFNGVICDGSYEDWEDYGHTTIEYDTPGSQEAHIDAKGALYANGEKLFGHVVTDAPDHLAEAGGEFLRGVTVAFNQKLSALQSGNVDRDRTFYCKFVTVDASGNINWNPKTEGYGEGTYRFAIASIDAWCTSTNINDLNEADRLYGEMYMTIGKGGKDEMEFLLDLPMVAEKLGLDPTDLKEIAAQFIRIGHQWIYTAGTSTGPLAGVALGILTVGFAFRDRKRKGRGAKAAAAGV